jgi:hypothetical protein
MVSIRTRRLGRRTAVAAATVGLALSMASAALAGVQNVPVTQVSQDPYTSTQNYHQTEVEPDTYSWGSTIVATHQTGRFTDGGSNNIGWDTSTNNGTTWTHGFLPGTTVYATPAGPWARISDPAVAYDPKHNVWLIEGLVLNSFVNGAGVIVNRSLDGGLTWQNPVNVSTNFSSYDKSWIACDTTSTSPFYGNCYVEVDDPSAGDLFRMFRSTDGGLTWTTSSTPSSSVLGGQPLVQPNGTVVVPIQSSGIDSFVSTNGGTSYTGPFNISSLQFHNPAGGIRNGLGLPSAEIDAAGKIYVAWSDCRFRSSCTANDIVFSTSTNGQTWSAVKRVPIVATTSPADFFIPGFGVDHSTSGATAHLVVTTYGYPNGSCNSTTCKLMAVYVSSTNGGTTWSAPARIVGPMSLKGLPNTTLGYMVGDYISTSFGSNGKAYPVVANATGSTCVTGNPTACHEPMVAPTNGLIATGGTRPATTGPVLFLGTPISVAGRTAF